MTISEEHAREIVCECELDAPPETVWRAVTIPEFLEEWMGVRPDTEGDADVSCEMIDQSPGSQVRFAWHDRRSDAPESLVTIDIESAPENRTRFRLSHSDMTIRMKAANDNDRAMRLAA
jgi:uncharacterized protein YndB with AHSA1/START domain